MPQWRYLSCCGHNFEQIGPGALPIYRELDVDVAEAFVNCNFAPPVLRRNISILGMFHKRVLGLSHPVFQDLLPFYNDGHGDGRPGTHNKQLYGHLHEANFQMALFCRSIFAMTYVYNGLPQNVVDCTTVSKFQRELILIARQGCLAGDGNWMHCFSARV